MALGDYVEYLASEARSGAAIVHEFRLLAAKDGSIHVFYEGEDDGLYYAPIIRRLTDTHRIHAYICDGKSGVAYAAAVVKTEGYDAEEKCLFFVDRDYDDHFDGQPEVDDLIYVTEGYSVENYLVCDSSFEIIVKEFCGFTATDPEISDITKAYKDGRRSYQSVMLPLLAWAVASREAGTSPNFANVQLGKVVKVSSDGQVVRRTTGFDVFRKACIGSGTSPSLGSVLKWYRAFSKSPPSEWLRGKFDLWLFEAVILAALSPAVASAKARGRKRVKIPAPLTQRHSFSMLGGRTAAVPSVEQYVRDRLAA